MEKSTMMENKGIYKMSGKKMKKRRTTITKQLLWMVVYMPSRVAKGLAQGNRQEKTHLEFPEDTMGIQILTRSHG